MIVRIAYINDIVYAANNAKKAMFADDTTLTTKSKSLNEAIKLMNEDL